MKYLFTLSFLILTIVFSFAQRGGQYHPHHGHHNNTHGYNHTLQNGTHVNIQINGTGPHSHRRPASCNRRTWTPCCANDFNRVMQSINAECFDSKRIRIARRLIANYHFSTNQLARILALFSFDSSRLAVAKFAYNYTYDRANYPNLYGCFTFRSSARELDRYIHGY